MHNINPKYVFLKACIKIPKQMKNTNMYINQIMFSAYYFFLMKLFWYESTGRSLILFR